MLNKIVKMTITEFKLYLREPVATFFTLVFPLMFLLLFGAIFGNETIEGTEYGIVDFMVPSYMGMIIGTVGILSVPISLASYREQGVLRRFRASPVEPGVLIVAQIIVNLIMMVLGVALLLIVARLVFGLKAPEAPLAIVPAFLLAGMAFFAVGAFLASVLNSPRTAQVVGQVVFFPLLFLSGATIPLSQMPEGIRNIAEWLPLTQVNMMIADLWFGAGWNMTAVVILGTMMVIAAGAASQIFRWE